MNKVKIVEAIKKVKATNFDSKEIENLFSITLNDNYLFTTTGSNITYGEWIHLIYRVCSIVQNFEQENPEKFNGSSYQKQLYSMFEWENDTADMLNIARDYLSDFNTYLISHHYVIIKKYPITKD